MGREREEIKTKIAGKMNTELLLDEKTIAYHEAGHVFMALHFGHKFKYVVLNGTDSYVRFYKRKVFEKLEAGIPLTAKNRKFLVEDIQVTLAGDIAGFNLLGIGNTIGLFTSDSDHVSDIISKLYVEDDEEYLIYWIDKTSETLCAPQSWKATSAIAESLIETKQLSYDKCLALYNSAVCI